jgi:hypothetical protein
LVRKTFSKLKHGADKNLEGLRPVKSCGLAINKPTVQFSTAVQERDATMINREPMPGEKKALTLLLNLYFG